MARYRRPLHRRLMGSAVVCCSVILLRPHGGGVLAQGNGNDDDDHSGNSTLPPAGGTSAGDDDASSSGYPDCPGYTSHIADGYCDDDLNIASCGWDGGDCCSCTCGQFLESGDEFLHPCGQRGGGFDCQDPDVPADCGVTPSPAASFGYPDCDGYMYGFQNSHCDDDLNNAACGWDGDIVYMENPELNKIQHHDSIGHEGHHRCDHRLRLSLSARNREYGGYDYGDDYGHVYRFCGTNGFDCRDPEAPNDCGTESPTPSPAATAGYPGCEGYIYGIGDGYCDSYNNTEECDWDGGDCPTPSPALYYGSAYTTGITLTDDVVGECMWSGDGMCDPSHNNKDCKWDGGDCCSCDCLDDSWECGEMGFQCKDPSSTCFGTSSTGSPNPFDDDALSEYGDREFPSSADSTEAGEQIISQGSSGSSFAGAEMAGVFVLSVSAFFLFACATLAACGFLRPRWCRGEARDRESAAAASAAAGDRAAGPAGAPPPKHRGWTWSRQKKSSVKVSQAQEQGGFVGAQENEDADEEAELGGTFCGAGGTGEVEAKGEDGGGVHAAAWDGNVDSSRAARDEEKDTSTPVAAGAGINDDGVPAEEKDEGRVADGGETNELEYVVREDTGVGGTEPEEAGDDVSVVEVDGVEEEAKSGAVEQDVAREEKKVEQESTAVEDTAGVDEKTTADKPGADGAAS
eukprot:g13142.t1